MQNEIEKQKVHIEEERVQKPERNGNPKLRNNSVTYKPQSYSLVHKKLKHFYNAGKEPQILHLIANEQQRICRSNKVSYHQSVIILLRMSFS